MLQITANLNQEKLQEVANQSAQNAIEAEIKDHYNSYNSAFRKQIKEQLGGISQTINLVKVLDIIKEGINAEFEKQTQIVSVNAMAEIIKGTIEAITKCPAEITFSEFLEQLKKAVKKIDDESYELIIEMSEHKEFGWLNTRLSCDGSNYEFTIHKDYISKSEEGKKPQTYTILSLPHEKGRNIVKYCLSSGNYIEFPLNRTIGDNPILMLVASMVLQGTKITMDKGLDINHYDLEIPKEEDECHCN
jgi:hypothetical protein